MNNKSIALFTALFTLFASYLSAAAPENNPTTFRNFELGGGITNVFQRSSSANRTFSPEGQASEVSWSFDLELSGIVGEHGKFFALYEAGLGEGIDAKFTGYSGFNGDANDQGKLSSTEIWYEYQKNEKSFRFRLGKIDFSSDFDTSSFANCEVEQFISSAFVNNLTLEFPEKYDFGAMLWIPLSNNLEIGAGAVDKFAIYELVYKLEKEGRNGNYRFFFWQNEFDHQSLKDPNNISAANNGFGLSFDQEITDKIGLFARYGRQKEEAAELETAWSLGMQCSSPFANRKQDVFGMAYGQAETGSAGKLLAIQNGVNNGIENHFEIYYSFKADEDLTITPSAQWIKNAAGNRAHDDAWLFGIRTQVGF